MIVTCCLRATPEEIQSDPSAYDCETCELRLQRARLTDHDHCALDCYHALQSAVVRDLRLTPVVFQILGLRMTRAEGRLLLGKLELVHQSVLSRSGHGGSDLMEDE